VRRAWAEASRAEEVRDAARGWKAAGAIDAATLASIQQEYPDSRIVLHRAWRVLVFLLVAIAIGAVFFGIFRGAGGMLAPSLTFAVLLAGATEVLRGSKLSGTGADAATSFWALVFLLVAFLIFLSQELHFGPKETLTFWLAVAAVVGALAAWRWGFWFFAAAGAVAFYLGVARIPAARTAWIVLSILAMAVAFRRLHRATVTPPHRESFAAAFAVSAAALYAAVSVYSLDRLLVERLQLWRFDATSAVWPAWMRALSALATAAFPAVFLAWGIRSRRRLLFAVGIVATALSVATLRHYVPIGPRWAFLTACGAVLVAAALWIHHRLRDAPAGVWRGLTAAPLYSVELGEVSPLAALAATSASPGAATEPDRGLMTGGGGFGGGGASGQY
jgi:hypothetical protein